MYPYTWHYKLGNGIRSHRDVPGRLLRDHVQLIHQAGLEDVLDGPRFKEGSRVESAHLQLGDLEAVSPVISVLLSPFLNTYFVDSRSDPVVEEEVTFLLRFLSATTHQFCKIIPDEAFTRAYMASRSEDCEARSKLMLFTRIALFRRTTPWAPAMGCSLLTLSSTRSVAKKANQGLPNPLSPATSRRSRF